MDPIKDAFSKAKQDIQALRELVETLSLEVNSLKSSINSLVLQQTNQHTRNSTHFSAKSSKIPTEDSLNQSILTESSNNPTDFWSYKALKPHIYALSTRNDGVPTNKPTNQQTNQHPNISSGNPHFEDISKLINSLDNAKKDLRSKFKRLTKQEMLVFSTIYQLEEEGFEVDYALIAKKLALSESSIRDYSQRIIKKGIPIQKLKQNNKKIYLIISSDLKKITSLQTLIQLREI